MGYFLLYAFICSLIMNAILIFVVRDQDKKDQQVEKFVRFYKKYPSQVELDAYTLREKETLEKLQDDLASRA